MAEIHERGTGAASRMILRIEPLDPLFFRDGRPFGDNSRAVSGLPRPQTFAGALRTAMLRRAEVDIAAVARGVRSGMAFNEAAAAAGGCGAAIPARNRSPRGAVPRCPPMPPSVCRRWGSLPDGSGVRGR